MDKYIKRTIEYDMLMDLVLAIAINFTTDIKGQSMLDNTNIAILSQQ